MSLLLDALKEAEKSRKGLEAATPAAEIISDSSSKVQAKELVLDLDLEQPSDSQQTNQPKTVPQEAQTPQKKNISETNLELEAGTPTPLDSDDKKETPAAAPATSSPTQQTPKPIPAPVHTKPEPIHSKTAPQTSPGKSTRVATDVFQNQQNGSSQSKSRLPLLLLILILVLIGLLGLYFLLSAEEESAFPQPTRTLNALAPQTPSIEGNTLPSMVSDVSEENITTTKLPTATAKAPIKEIPVNKAAKSTEKAVVVEATKKTPSTNNVNRTASESQYDVERVQPAQSTQESNKRAQNKLGIQISKRKLSARSQSSLSAAKQALGTGNLAAAENAYRQALAKSPGNVTAMSALANVLVQQGKTQEARALFVETLQKDPENLTAKAGLINITAADPSNLSAGSELKQLLTEHPQEAYLHASLGNFHARRNEWPSAQASYFEAFALDPENPDYAFNLAVGLDQIGKPNIAINYYEKAIELVGERAPHFNKADVERRLNELKGPKKPKGTTP